MSFSGGGPEAPVHIAVLSLHPLFDTRIRSHLRTLIEAGLAVTYINMSNKGPLDEKLGQDIELVHADRSAVVGFNPVKYLKLLCWFLSQSRRTGARLIHIHDPLLMPLIPILNLLGRKCVFDAHEHYDRFPGMIGWFYRLCYRFCLGRASGVVGVSPSTVPPRCRHSVVVPNYQSRSDFDPFMEGGDRSAPGDPVRVVYFGNLFSENRDVSGMLEAARLVLRDRDDVCFEFGGVLHGSNAEVDRKRFEDLARRYPDRFVWYGQMSRQQVIERTAGADIGLWILSPKSMNVAGANPNKVFEYLTVGAAIVATEGFVIGHQIRRAKAGELIPLGALPAYIAQRIIDLVTDQKRLGQVKEASEQLGKQFAWQQVGPRYLQLYEQIGAL